VERALNTGKVQIFDRVGNLLQMLRRQVQISGRGLEIFVPEQHLDGAQVGACLEQMRGPAVTQRVRSDALADAGATRCFDYDVPYRLVGDRLLDQARGARWKQECARLEA
jgi:hypothetical protein